VILALPADLIPTVKSEKQYAELLIILHLKF